MPSFRKMHEDKSVRTALLLRHLQVLPAARVALFSPCHARVQGV